MEIKKALDIFKGWHDYVLEHKDIVNEADTLIDMQETIISHILDLENENYVQKCLLFEGKPQNGHHPNGVETSEGLEPPKIGSSVK